MKRWAILLLAAFASATVTLAATKQLVPVKPQPQYGVILNKQETEKYLDAAVRFSPYKKPWFARPKIDVVQVAKWQGQVCGAEDYDCGILGYTSEDELDIVHVVDTMPARAVERLGWTRDEVIVHELVHWLQIQSGATFPDKCAEVAAMEVEAYNAQFQYAVQVLGADHGFWAPDIYGNCVLAKMMKQRGHH